MESEYKKIIRNEIFRFFSLTISELNFFSTTIANDSNLYSFTASSKQTIILFRARAPFSVNY